MTHVVSGLSDNSDTISPRWCTCIISLVTVSLATTTSPCTPTNPMSANPRTSPSTRLTSLRGHGSSGVWTIYRGHRSVLTWTLWQLLLCWINHYIDVIIGAMKSQITGVSKKTSKLCVTDLCEGNSPVTGEFPARRASNAENASIWWRHHDFRKHENMLAFPIISQCLDGAGSWNSSPWKTGNRVYLIT